MSAEQRRTRHPTLAKPLLDRLNCPCFFTSSLGSWIASSGSTISRLSSEPQLRGSGERENCRRVRLTENCERGHWHLLGKRAESGSRPVGVTRRGLLESDQSTSTIKCIVPTQLSLRRMPKLLDLRIGELESPEEYPDLGSPNLDIYFEKRIKEGHR